MISWLTIDWQDDHGTAGAPTTYSFGPSSSFSTAVALDARAILILHNLSLCRGALHRIECEICVASRGGEAGGETTRPDGDATSLSSSGPRPLFNGTQPSHATPSKRRPRTVCGYVFTRFIYAIAIFILALKYTVVQLSLL